MSLNKHVALAATACAALWATAEPPAQICPVAPSLLLAEYQLWHGLHKEAFRTCWLPEGRAYDSRSPAVVASHIAKAKAMGIDGFVVDWYGPPAGVANDVDRGFMTEALNSLMNAAAAQDFKVAVLYDEGTLKQAGVPPGGYMALAAADLQYAVSNYVPSSAYLKLAGRPALFVFPYPDVDPLLQWDVLRAGLSAAVTLIDKDPDGSWGHDSLFDGFFAWVQADWRCDGQEWGEGYLHAFYDTMSRRGYASKLTVGGVWPGFDDRLAPWGLERFVSRRNGAVWEATCKLATERGAPVVMISTWNDFEEGTDVEFGIDMTVDMEDPLPEVLIRSLPFRVGWDPSRGDLELQVYTDCRVDPILTKWHSPGDLLVSDLLLPGRAYEIKVWPGPIALTKAVKTRRFDPPRCN